MLHGARDSLRHFDDNSRVHIWNTHWQRGAETLTHTLAPGFGHALLAPLVAHTFQLLRISAAVWEHGSTWFPIYTEPSVVSFEPEHAVEEERYAYNERHLAQVLRGKRSVRGEHAGYSDLFVPILVSGEVVAILVVGPFALARPTSSDVQEQWHWLTGRQAQASDAEFGAYLAMALATLVLEGDRARHFERLLECLARLLSGEGPATELANEAEVLRTELARARLDERMGDAVREMIDERSARRWLSSINRAALKRLGLARAPDSVLVALTAGRSSSEDPVDEAIRRNVFQRGSVELARRVGQVIAGPVGDHGVVFLCASSSSNQRKQQRLLEIAEQVSSLARRRLGLSVHCGTASAPPGASLSQSYQAALAAAERALVLDVKVIHADGKEQSSAHSLRHLRQALRRDVEQHPDQLGPQLDRYIEAAAAHCGYRSDALRAHLDIGFEQMAEPLLHSGALDEKSLNALRRDIDRESGAARTTTELMATYRAAVTQLSHAVNNPAMARHDRNLRYALEHIQREYAGPMRLEQVARLAGFTPTYFSRLFKQRQGTTFERYVSALRIERARQLLTSTALSITRVSQLCGLNSPEYFARAFGRALGVTPLAYRQRPGSSKKRANRSIQKLIKVPGTRRARPLTSR
ncbi:MAG TPA: helix-turn-helix domain-containing protein [Polyangiaceae bacterium]|nr:helix-turn-helix domain-containing protein [Polyangiaceae bacterium]